MASTHSEGLMDGSRHPKSNGSLHSGTSLPAWLADWFRDAVNHWIAAEVLPFLRQHAGGQGV